MENAFKFPNFSLHCKQICSLLYTFKKYMFAIYFQKIDGAAKGHLLLPHVPWYTCCRQHFRDIHFALNTLFHLHFNPIFHILLSNLVDMDYDRDYKYNVTNLIFKLWWRYPITLSGEKYFLSCYMIFPSNQLIW